MRDAEALTVQGRLLAASGGPNVRPQRREVKEKEWIRVYTLPPGPDLRSLGPRSSSPRRPAGVDGMETPLRLLIVSDSEPEAELLRDGVAAAPVTLRRPSASRTKRVSARRWR